MSKKGTDVKCSRCKNATHIEDIIIVNLLIVCVDCHAFDEYGVVL